MGRLLMWLGCSRAALAGAESAGADYYLGSYIKAIVGPGP